MGLMSSAVDGKDQIQLFLDRMFSTDCCSWCEDHERRLYRKKQPLCSSCAHIQTTIKKYERLVRTHPPEPGRAFDYYGHELKVAKQMKVLAKRDGNLFGNINSRIVSAVDVEQILSTVSRMAVGRALFLNYSQIGRLFGDSERKLVYHLMSRIVRAHHCKHRSSMARYTRIAEGTK